MLKLVSRTVATVLTVVALTACGFSSSATFNADGSVTIGLKFLFPKSMMQGDNGMSVSGFSASDIANSNAELQKKYPGGKVTAVTEGDESGALITIPFKTEKDAFDFITSPTALNPSKATSGASVNLANTGGLFASASHTSSGGTDTYTFKTAPAQQASPTPGSQQVLTNDEVASMFSITFTLTVPHVITSAPGALFTLDRKTAIWKLNWTKAETLTATTSASTDAALVSSVAAAPDMRLVVAVAFIAIGLGFLLGMFLTWRGLGRTRLAVAAVQAPPIAAPPAMPPPPPAPPQADVEWPGPPPGAPPPTQV